ncbi:hypothetical protein PILCRDRAFT_86111 [Piloderma croceum F 1598]|uniref:Uncharacterized protein n=1 Tax=Piloderma croceum (strain F 1598) TaxID=765440 RepID=A0A0C3G8I4_PILCF|nr:hypothetical protein PILCRDRAFT_86111 [Piloderma croceum F 1598]
MLFGSSLNVYSKIYDHKRGRYIPFYKSMLFGSSESSDVTIDWILLIRQGTQLLFTQAAYTISRPRFWKSRVEGVGSAEKVRGVGDTDYTSDVRAGAAYTVYDYYPNGTYSVPFRNSHADARTAHHGLSQSAAISLATRDLAAEGQRFSLEIPFNDDYPSLPYINDARGTGRLCKNNIPIDLKPCFRAITYALADYLIGAVEEVQSWLLSQILNNLHRGALPKVPLEGHRVVMLCLTWMLTQSDIMMQGPNIGTGVRYLGVPRRRATDGLQMESYTHLEEVVAQDDRTV